MNSTRTGPRSIWIILLLLFFLFSSIWVIWSLNDTANSMLVILLFVCGTSSGLLAGNIQIQRENRRKIRNQNSVRKAGGLALIEYPSLEQIRLKIALALIAALMSIAGLLGVCIFFGEAWKLKLSCVVCGFLCAVAAFNCGQEIQSKGD
jgi:hypothetical protein